MNKKRESEIDKKAWLTDTEAARLYDIGVTAIGVTQGYMNKIVVAEYKNELCYAKIFTRPDRYENEKFWLSHFELYDNIDFIPKIRTSIDGDELNKPILVLSAVNGVFIKNTSNEQTKRIITILDSIVTRLNHLNQGCTNAQGTVEAWMKEREFFINLWLKNVIKSPYCDETTRSLAISGYTEYLEGSDLIRKTSDLGFVHSDINARNISVDLNGRVVGIIDFEFATYGDRLYDAVRIMWRLIGDSGKVGRDILRQAGFADFSADQIERLRLYRLFNYLGSLSFYFASGASKDGEPSAKVSIDGIRAEVTQRDA